MRYYLFLYKTAAWLRKCTAIIVLLFLGTPVYSQIVSDVSVSPAGPYCEGDNITVTFTLSGLLTGLSTGTTFEIVNNSGATVFADITPATTPVYNTNGIYSINLTIPYGGVAGGNRRIRVTNYWLLTTLLSSNARSSAFIISAGSVGGITASSTTVGCNGSNGGTLNLSGHTGTVLKWQYSTNGGGAWTDIANTTISQSYINLTVSTMYRAVVQNGTCAAANSVAATITVPPAIVFGSTTVTNNTCYSANNGKVTTSATGGTGALSYSISPSAGTQSPAGTFNNLPANSYTITVTDANGCTKTANAVVTEPTLVTFSYNKVDVTSCVSGNGSITVTAAGGTGSYQYSNDNGTTYQAANVFSGLSAGVYNIKVKDANGCLSSTIPVTINIATVSPSVTAATHTNVTCAGGNDGTLTFSGLNGTSPYTYSIDNGSNYIFGTNPKTFINLVAGSYQVKVKDANGCESASTNITINTSFPKPAGTIAGNTICEGEQATITFNATAGTPPFMLVINGTSYSGISPGVPFNILNPPGTATYTLTSITDNNSCTNP